MFRRLTRQSPFWPAAALLALLAAPHTLLAQKAPPTVRAEVTNWTGKDIEFALVGPDGKALGPARSVKYRYVYRTTPRTLPGKSAKGYKWVVRDSATKKVWREVAADRAQQSIPVGIMKSFGEVAKESRSAHVTNRTAKPIEFALVRPDGKDLGPARSVQPGKPYQTSNRTLPKGSAKGYKWVVRNPATKRVLKEVPADWTYQGIVVDSGKRIGGRGAEVTFTSGDETIKGYLAVPEGKGPFPAIVVIQEWFGLTDWIKDNAKRLAKDGYVCLAPDLYRGKVAKDSTDAMELKNDALSNGRALRDLKGAVNFLANHAKVNKGKIGAIGWCMGGTLSLELSLADKRVVACVMCYGPVEDFLGADGDKKLKSLNATVLGIYGKEDGFIPIEEVHNFEKALKEKGKKLAGIKEYDGGHGFMRDVKGDKGYNAKEAKAAWKEIGKFFAKELKGK
jgi:carboxymethylenebutenolidase